MWSPILNLAILASLSLSAIATPLPTKPFDNFVTRSLAETSSSHDPYADAQDIADALLKLDRGATVSDETKPSPCVVAANSQDPTRLLSCKEPLTTAQLMAISALRRKYGDRLFTPERPDSVAELPSAPTTAPAADGASPPDDDAPPNTRFNLKFLFIPLAVVLFLAAVILVEVVQMAHKVFSNPLAPRSRSNSADVYSFADVKDRRNGDRVRL
ncbi:MAG: hypothetical protein M1833_003139 [Piccolia ochrophora]|nr:MAG: hypothetical protein M1833_003139 [Piccolia ochrophora]